MERAALIDRDGRDLVRAAAQARAETKRLLTESKRLREAAERQLPPAGRGALGTDVARLLQESRVLRERAERELDRAETLATSYASGWCSLYARPIR